MSRRSQPPGSIGDGTMSTIQPAASVAQQSISGHAILVLADRDHAVFFDTLIYPPGQNDRLKAAFAEHARRVERPRQTRGG